MSKIIYNQPSSYRNKPNNHFTLITNFHCDSNFNNNHHKSNANKINSERKPSSVLANSYNSLENRHCLCRQGDLMINGGFENRKDPFFGWLINNGVEQINPNKGDIAHQGLNAANLGCPDPHALLYQDVPGICPGKFYQLNFFMSAATEYGNAPVIVRIDYMDDYKNLLAYPALEILIPMNSLSNEVFTGFNNVTCIAAHPEARFARISFEMNTHKNRDGYIHLDDVSLIGI